MASLKLDFKKLLRQFSLVIVGIVFAVSVLVVLNILFNKKGDNVYVVEINGDVSLGNSDTIGDLKDLSVNTLLSVNDVITTGANSSCILAYTKKVNSKDNYIAIGENSQVVVYKKHEATGGYDFYIGEGSVICNMSNKANYITNITTPLSHMFVDNTITKISYNSKLDGTDVYTFAGNPQLQLVYPTGNLGNLERLAKNSACAIRNTVDNGIAFGSLNVEFKLNELTAQDLKIMSGIAGNKNNKMSYGSLDFEQAFKNADDYDRWTETQVVTIKQTEPALEQTTSVNSTETVVNSDTVNSTNISVSDTLTDNIITTVPDISDDISETTGRTVITEYVYTKPKESESEPIDDTTTVHTTKPAETTKPITTAKPVYTTKPAPTTTQTTVVYKDSYKVVFTYGSAFYTVQFVKHGQSAIAPEPPVVAGKTFVRWDKSYTNIMSDMEIHAVYADSASGAIAAATASSSYNPIVSNNKSDTYTVQFYVNDKLWQTVTVKRGESATANIPTSSKNAKFIGWNTNTDNIQDNMIVFALFTNE